MGRVAIWLSGALLLAVIIAMVWFLYHVKPAIQVGTAVISQALCGEVFVAGLDPERVFREEIAPRPEMHLLLKHALYTTDAQRRK